jgi:hypothetical protein
MRPISRRHFLSTLARGAASTSLAASLGAAFAPAIAHADTSRLRRLIIFYFPDGIPGRSANGEPSLFHATGSGTSFTLPELLQPLQPHRDHLVLFNGLSMGGTDSGSHPGGARKLLTGVDYGNGESIDRVLARTAGADMPHRHIYLGAQSTAGGLSSDRFISYIGPGSSTTPEDDPRRAFDRLFPDGAGAGEPPGPGGPDPLVAARRRSILDTAMADLADLRGRLMPRDQSRLDLHLDALREVELRISDAPPVDAPAPTVLCPPASPSGLPTDTGRIGSDPEVFPVVLRNQIDLLVNAMACNRSRIGVLQASYHTSELIMSRFVGTELHDPGFDMRSHQASHYGASHNFGHREFRDFVAQRRWFVQQYAALIQALRDRPEGAGTMLDYSAVLLCSEVSDGNTHQHDDMPFLLAGGAAAGIRTGRLLDNGWRRHGDLYASLSAAMGHPIDGFGQGSSGPLPGLLG